MNDVRIDPGVEPRVRVGWLRTTPVRTVDNAALDTAIATSVATLRERHGGATAGQVEHLQPARELYRAFGLDPTRHRPSPEALLRRLLRGDEFPRVHPAVDLGNLWAVLHGLPVGLYDLAKVDGPVTVREGRADETYEGIRKGEIHVAGRLVVADGLGAFGNPSSDSLRTCVDGDSRELLFVLFAPKRYDRSNIRHWLEWLGQRVREHLGAESTYAIVG